MCGTVETGVIAEFEAPDEERGFEYSGDTDLQDQATLKNECGESLVVCADGHDRWTLISDADEEAEPPQGRGAAALGHTC